MIGNHQSLPRHRFNSIVNDSIRLAKPVWSQSISVCQCYHSSQDGQSQHILLSHLPDVTPQYAMHLMAFLWSTAETIPQTHLCQDVFTLSHCWFILMRRSPPLYNNRKKRLYFESLSHLSASLYSETRWQSCIAITAN